MTHKIVKIIAHRGNSSEAPENTLAAFEQAIEMGADYLECDIQLTKDLCPVIVHDPNLKKITSQRITHQINQLYYSEIEKLDIGSWFNSNFRNQRILTLENFLKLSNKINIMLDIKEETVKNQKEVILISNLIQKYKETNATKEILIGSLNLQIMKWLEQIFDFKELISIVEYEKDFEAFLSLHCQYFAIESQIATQSMINTLKKKGKRVWIWVVDDINYAQNLANQEIDGIITNTPKKIISSFKKSI